MNKIEIVSFDNEMLIVVDENDTIIDYKSKIECHQGNGILHRAFSIFIFNDLGQLILQKRSGRKLLWPLYWSNSCCSHPRKGETLDTAIHRRLEQELGLDTDLIYLYTFQYQASFKEVGSEHELCAVYIGKSDESVQVNENEIAEWRYLNPDDLTREVADHPENFTPWFKMEWTKLTTEFMDKINTLL
ncbi:MAG: isopentenyl-diphosphate Delta-isomerase [Calditrichia bacterium]|nr:isopentenyl-diphosphate Delta-isomerase [Calditrichia bacterium]